MARIDWNNIVIKPKELAAVLTFVFTMSGVWYKIYYENANIISKQGDIIKGLNDLQNDMKDYKAQTEKRLRLLEDDKTSRDAIKEVAPGFYPMTPIKRR